MLAYSLVKPAKPIRRQALKEEKRSKSGNSVAVVGVVGLAALCCAGPLVLGTLGVGAVLAAVTSWWVLLPTAAAASGIVAWYAWRRSCRIRESRASEPRRLDRTRERTRQ